MVYLRGLRDVLEFVWVQAIFVLSISVLIQTLNLRLKERIQSHIIHVAIQLKVLEQGCFSLESLVKFDISPKSHFDRLIVLWVTD